MQPGCWPRDCKNLVEDEPPRCILLEGYPNRNSGLTGAVDQVGCVISCREAIVGNQRIPGPLSQVDRPVTLHPGINTLTAVTLPGPTGANAKTARWLALSVDGAEPLSRGDSAPSGTRFFALTVG